MYSLINNELITTRFTLSMLVRAISRMEGTYGFVVRGTVIARGLRIQIGWRKSLIGFWALALLSPLARQEAEKQPWKSLIIPSRIWRRNPPNLTNSPISQLFVLPPHCSPFFSLLLFPPLLYNNTRKINLPMRSSHRLVTGIIVPTNCTT
jgi:hypothetical protein